MTERQVGAPNEPSVNPAEQSFEQRLLQSELISSQQVTLREVLKRKGRDSEGIVEVLDIPINFQVRDGADSYIHIVSFPQDGIAFGGQSLVTLLRAAKPVGKEGQVRTQSRQGIIDDWRIMQEKARESEPYLNSLYASHSGASPTVRERFMEFGLNHSEAFWDAMYNAPKKDIFYNLRVGYDALMSEKKAFAMFGLDFLKPNFLAFLRTIDNSFRFRDALGQFLKKEFNIAVSNLSGDFRFSGNGTTLFGSFTDEMKENLITDFYEQLDDDERNKFTYQVVSLYNFPRSEATILVDKNGSPHDMYEDVFIKQGKGISRISDDEVEIRTEDSYIRVRFELDERTGHREKRTVAIRIRPQEGEITPVIVWKKDKTTRKREYFCGRVSDDLIQAFPDMFSKRHDTLLGQIVVAGHSDELKRILPTKLPLVKGGKKQDMLEPQMPVFVPLFARAYLNMSPVISGLEELGDKR